MTRHPERIVSCLLTGLAVFLHAFYAFHAGGLWRDEANTVALATMPTLHDVWTHLQYDSFPILWLLVVRAFSAFGVIPDLAYRLLGCFVGFSIIAAVWINARLLKFSVPLVSLALLGFSPTIIWWGDSMRAYGFGICLILLTFGLIWRVVTAPGIGTVTLAAVAALCSVQALYYNGVLLLAMGVAGAVVAVRNRHWKRAFLVLGIGGLAALSLIPYVWTIRGASEWNIIITLPNFDLQRFWIKLSEALSTAGPGLTWVWVGLASVALATVVTTQFRPAAEEEVDRRQAGWYCLISLLISVPAYFVFLKILRYPTNGWYYVALMGFLAMSMDGCLSAWPPRSYPGRGRWILALGVVFWSLLPAWNAVSVRLTSVDIAARTLNEQVTAEDMIIVNPWYVGVSFHRYYHGAAPWNTIPPIRFHAFHRYDLVKEQMAASNPIESLLETINDTLKSGHRVWIVGYLPFQNTEAPPPPLAPAPSDPVGWSEYAYTTTWATQVADFIKRRALKGESFGPLTKQPVNRLEEVSILAIEGWRDPSL